MKRSAAQRGASDGRSGTAASSELGEGRNQIGGARTLGAGRAVGGAEAQSSALRFHRLWPHVGDPAQGPAWTPRDEPAGVAEPRRGRMRQTSQRPQSTKDVRPPGAPGRDRRAGRCEGGGVSCRGRDQRTRPMRNKARKKALRPLRAADSAAGRPPALGRKLISDGPKGLGHSSFRGTSWGRNPVAGVARLRSRLPQAKPRTTRDVPTSFWGVGCGQKGQEKPGCWRPLPSRALPALATPACPRLRGAGCPAGLSCRRDGSGRRGNVSGW